MDVFSYLMAAARAVLYTSLVLIVATFWLSLGWLPWLTAAGALVALIVLAIVARPVRGARLRRRLAAQVPTP